MCSGASCFLQEGDELVSATSGNRSSLFNLVVLVTCYQENWAALRMSVTIPGALGGDSHQTPSTEGGLVFLREHLDTCVAWAAWC